MLPRRALLSLVAASLSLAGQQGPPPPRSADTDRDPNRVRLPSGELQTDAIAKADYENQIEDAHKLAKLASDLSAEIEKNDRYVVSMSVMKKTEEIEKLAKRIRSRWKRY